MWADAVADPGAPPCPNVANHQPHPTGYVNNATWADDALLVAEQERCTGCGRWEIWVPFRPGLRIAVDWPPSSCDWGGCNGDGVAERRDSSGTWLPVCRDHLGITLRRPAAGRGRCSGCGREFALYGDGLVRAHNDGAERCDGGGWAARMELVS